MCTHPTSIWASYKVLGQGQEEKQLRDVTETTFLSMDRPNSRDQVTEDAGS